MDWTEYKPDGSDYIPMCRWGKDHWSTFLYLEACAVDYGGKVTRQRMRCDPRVHRELVGSTKTGGKYPTILKDGELKSHDDWSCLEDMVAAGLVKAWTQTAHSDKVFGSTEARVELTPLGWHIIGQLRRHRASGGKTGDFSPPSLQPVPGAEPQSAARAGGGLEE